MREQALSQREMAPEALNLSFQCFRVAALVKPSASESYHG